MGAYHLLGRSQDRAERVEPGNGSQLGDLGQRRWSDEGVHHPQQTGSQFCQPPVTLDISGVEAGETGQGVFQIPVEQQPGAVPEAGAYRHVSERVLQAEPAQVQLIGDAENHAVVDGAPLQAVAGRKLFGPDAAAHRRVGLEHGDIEAGVGEEARADQTVVAPTDHRHPGHRNEWTPLSPASRTTARASDRPREIWAASSIVVRDRSARSRRPSTQTSLTEPGPAQ